MRNDSQGVSLLGQLYLYFNPDYHRQLIVQRVDETIARSRRESRQAIEEAERISGLPKQPPRRRFT